MMDFDELDSISIPSRNQMEITCGDISMRIFVRYAERTSIDGQINKE